MKTLVISAGDAPLPQALRDVIARGSTSVEQRRAADVHAGASMPDADRIVFWSTGSDAALRHIAMRYARAERSERREAIVFVTTARSNIVAGLPSSEVFVWPDDQDRLTMAFMTGA